MHFMCTLLFAPTPFPLKIIPAIAIAKQSASAYIAFAKVAPACRDQRITNSAGLLCFKRKPSVALFGIAGFIKNITHG